MISEAACNTQTKGKCVGKDKGVEFGKGGMVGQTLNKLNSLRSRKRIG